MGEIPYHSCQSQQQGPLLRGPPVKLQVLVVGNKTETVDSEVFKFVNLGKDGIEVSIEAYGILRP